MKIYVDMDNVIVDLMKVVCDIGKVPLNRQWDFGDRQDIWDHMKDEGAKFWEDLPWMPDGKKLWNSLKKYNPTILSSPTQEYSSIEGKKAWIDKEIPETDYILERKKYKYAKPGDILIDDLEKNTSKWEEHGGTAILHKNAEDTLEQLGKILSTEKETNTSKEAITKVKPYDALVGEVVREMGPELKNVDVIVLEPVCTGNTHGFVHNKDLLMGRPGEERIIHLCLPQIKQDFKKQFRSNYNIGNPNDQKKMKQMLKDYLRSVVIPHEMVHIQQETERGGEFGPSPETMAEKAEDWSVMTPYGITKRSSNIMEGLMKEGSSIVSLIDKMASIIEKKGFLKEAYELDIIANTIEMGAKQASLDFYIKNNVIDWMKKNAPVQVSQLTQMMEKGFDNWILDWREPRNRRKIESEWEKLLTPEVINFIAQSTSSEKHILSKLLRDKNILVQKVQPRPLPAEPVIKR